MMEESSQSNPFWHSSQLNRWHKSLYKTRLKLSFKIYTCSLWIALWIYAACPFVKINIKIKEWVGDFQIEEVWKRYTKLTPWRGYVTFTSLCERGFGYQKALITGLRRLDLLVILAADTAMFLTMILWNHLWRHSRPATDRQGPNVRGTPVQHIILIAEKQVLLVF